MSTWFYARAPAGHFASTVGKPRDQRRLRRCNPSTSTIRSAFGAVDGHGGARIVAASSPPSDPSDGRGDAPKANPPRAAVDEYGLNGYRGAAHIQPGRLGNDDAPWRARGRPSNPQKKPQLACQHRLRLLYFPKSASVVWTRDSSLSLCASKVASLLTTAPPCGVVVLA